jgi:predicted ribosome quality control (RQC) complex YloA/Tae2 family protein
MIELSGLDLRYAVAELGQLKDAKVEKVFQSDTNKRDILFVMYLRDAPKIHLRFMLPGFVCTQKEKPATPQQPPGFSMFLRKYLSGTRLHSVEQRGFDRIIDMTFASKTATFHLIIELMQPGNMLLTDSEGRIINLLENAQYKDRTLRARQPYTAPPSVDISALGDDELASRITVSTRDSIVTTLAINCQLGGIYAEEACIRAGIAKQRNDLSAAEVRQVVGAIRELFSQPLLAHCDEHRAYPFRLQSRLATQCSDTSFLTALSGFITEEEPSKAEARQKQRASPQGKLQAIIDAQSQQAARLEAEIVQTQRKGERIFEEYQLMQEILQAVREAREKKQDIAKALARFPQVKAYRSETGELELEIDDNAQ